MHIGRLPSNRQSGHVVSHVAHAASYKSSSPRALDCKTGNRSSGVILKVALRGGCAFHSSVQSPSPTDSHPCRLRAKSTGTGIVLRPIKNARAYEHLRFEDIPLRLHSHAVALSIFVCCSIPVYLQDPITWAHIKAFPLALRMSPRRGLVGKRPDSITRLSAVVFFLYHSYLWCVHARVSSTYILAFITLVTSW